MFGVFFDVLFLVKAVLLERTLVGVSLIITFTVETFECVRVRLALLGL